MENATEWADRIIAQIDRAENATLCDEIRDAFRACDRQRDADARLAVSPLVARAAAYLYPATADGAPIAPVARPTRGRPRKAAR